MSEGGRSEGFMLTELLVSISIFSMLILLYLQTTQQLALEIRKSEWISLLTAIDANRGEFSNNTQVRFDLREEEISARLVKLSLWFKDKKIDYIDSVRSYE